jgi:hypothetical protein
VLLPRIPPCMPLVFGLLVAGCSGSSDAGGDSESSSGPGTDDTSTGCGLACEAPGTEIWTLQTQYSDCDRLTLTADASAGVYLDGYEAGAPELSRIDPADGHPIWTVGDVPDARHLAVAGWRNAAGVLVVTQVLTATGFGGATFAEYDESGAVLATYVLDDGAASSKFGAMSVDGEDGIWSVVELDQTDIELRRFVRGGALDWTSALGTLGRAPSFAYSAGMPAAGTVLMGRKTTDVLVSYRPDGSTWTTELPASLDAAHVHVDATGAVHVAATEYITQSDSRVHVLQFDAAGEQTGDIVHDTGGAELSDRARKLVVDADGAVILASDEVSGEDGPFATRTRVTRYVDGELAWTQVFEPQPAAAAKATACSVAIGPEGLVLFAFQSDAGSDPASIVVHAFAP